MKVSLWVLLEKNQKIKVFLYQWSKTFSNFVNWISWLFSVIIWWHSLFFYWPFDLSLFFLRLTDYKFTYFFPVTDGICDFFLTQCCHFQKESLLLFFLINEQLLSHWKQSKEIKTCNNGFNSKNRTLERKGGWEPCE